MGNRTPFRKGEHRYGVWHTPNTAPRYRRAPRRSSSHTQAVGLRIQITSFLVTGLLAVACAIGVRRDRRWVAYRVATAIAAPLLIVLSGAIMSWGGVLVALAGAVMFGWVGAVPAHVGAELRKEQPRGLRFDAKLEQRMTELRAAIERRLGEQTRWLFGAWALVLASVIGLWFRR